MKVTKFIGAVVVLFSVMTASALAYEYENKTHCGAGCGGTCAVSNCATCPNFTVDCLQNTNGGCTCA